MDFNDIFKQVVPLYTQLNFWLTILGTVLLWYAVSVAFAHVFFGAGNRSAVEAANQGMNIALLLLAVALAAGAYFLFKPTDLIYLGAVTLTFLLLAIILHVIFSKMGARA